MSSLVIELQSDALNKSVPISDLLRKALVVSKKLGIHDIEEWIENELIGYKDINAVPDYRVICGQVTVSDYWGSRIPLFFKDAKLERYLSFMNYDRPISDVESIAKGRNIEIKFQADIKMKYLDKYNMPTLKPDFTCFDVILDTVRNIILKWSLKLEEDGIIGEGMTFSKKEKEIAGISNYNVQFFSGPVSNSQIQQDTESSLQAVSYDFNKVNSLLQKIRESIDNLKLSDENEKELISDIQTIESQINSPNPKHGIIKELLASIRTVLEGAGGNMVANGLIELLKQL